VSTSLIITIVIGSVIAAAALIGVIVGVVTKGGWSDNGFSKPQWYLPHLIVLDVMFDTTLEPAWVNAVRSAITRLNDACGREVLSIVAPIPGYDWGMMPRGGIVTIVKGSADANPCTEHRYEDDGVPRPVGSRVTLPQKFVGNRHAVALHEMGHVLRLKHDENPGSIMYYKLTATGKLTAADENRLYETFSNPRTTGESK